MSKSFKIFVAFHKQLVNEHYTCDSSFDLSKFTFIKCNEKYEAEYDKNFGYNVICEKDFKFYDSTLQRKRYMASSVIYHLYKNKIYENYDYIGFLECDMILKSEVDESIKVCESIEEKIRQFNKVIIPFSYRHSVFNICNQRDIRLNGAPTCGQILKDYNEFFGTNYEYKQFKTRSDLLITQQSFLADRGTFKDTMKFIEHVVDNKLAERSNSLKRPAAHMDRYIGISLKLSGVKEVPIHLIHANFRQW